jgi:hypothetical protein
MTDKSTAELRSMLRHPANTRRSTLDIAEEIIARYQVVNENQRDAISRLLTAVPLKEVPELGTQVRFKLADGARELTHDLHPAELMPYLRVKTAYPDDGTGVIVELEAMD